MVCLVVRLTPQCLPSSFRLFFHGAGCPELGKYCLGSCIVRAVREVGKSRLGPAALTKVPCSSAVVYPRILHQSCSKRNTRLLAGLQLIYNLVFKPIANLRCVFRAR